MLEKTLKVALSAVLGVTLCISLGACQQANTNQTQASGETYRWDNFDDGSDVLDVDASYIPANVDNFNFNVIVERGRLSDAIKAQDVTLLGAIADWQVTNATKKDDVTASISIKKPEGWGQNGASIAQVGISADVIEPEESATSDISNSNDASAASEASATSDASNSNSNDATSSNETAKTQDGSNLTADEVNEERQTEWPNDDSSAIIENTDTDATGEEVQTWNEMGGVFGEGADDALNISSTEETQNQDQDTPATYIVAVVFANPYLNMDTNSLSFKDGKLTLKAQAVDFELKGNIEKKSLSVVNADGKTSNVSVESAKLASGTELEVVLSVPNSDLSTLDEAYLVLAADANETQEQVQGALKIPDPYLSVSMDYKNDEKAVFIANVDNTNDKISTNDIAVAVDNEQVQGVNVTQNDNGECEISVPASAIQDDSAVEIKVANIKDYAGEATQELSSCASIEEAPESREVPIEVKELGKGVGTSLLASLASAGWEQLCRNIFDPGLNTSIYDVTNNELLQKMVELEDKLVDISQQINSLYNTVEAGQYESIVTNTQQVISTVYNQECLLKGKMKKIYSLPDGTAREQATKEFYANSANTTLVDSLATNMGVLHDKIVQASPRSGKDLVQVYDDMCATSYNWAKQGVTSRTNFREQLATVWSEGTLIIETVYGKAAQDEQADTLTRFNTMTNNVNTLINTTHVIKEDSYQKTSNGKTAYYNYSAGKWFTTTLGSESKDGWDDAFYGIKRKELRIKATTPFTAHSIKCDDFRNNDHAMTSSGTYATTSEVKAMLARLRDGQTLKEELDSIKLTNAKYLITSEALDASLKVGWHNNIWRMDTFEVSACKKDGSGFTHNKTHFDGWVRNGKSQKNKYHTNSKTAPADMFILKYA